MAWKTVDEIHDEDSSLVAVISSAPVGQKGRRRRYAFCLLREFIKNGISQRTAFLRPGDAAAAQRLIDRAVRRIDQEP